MKAVSEVFRMAQFKSGPPAPRRVWRITPDAPSGKYVDVDNVAKSTPTPPPVRPEPADPTDIGWIQSSFDLSDGLDVLEDDDTVPAPLMDELFSKRSGAS
jgi:hypothetical protein